MKVSLRALSSSLLFIAIVTGTGLADEALKQRLLREAPEGWGRLKDAEMHTSGQLHVEWWSEWAGVRNPGFGATRIYNFKRNCSSICLISPSITKPPASGVECVGPNYTFTLSRASDSEPYVLRDKALGPPEVASGDLIKSTFFFPAMQAPRELRHVSLQDIIHSSGIKLMDVATFTEAGRPLVKVTFDGETDQPKKGRFKDAWMILDPDSDWALLSAEYSTKPDSRTAIKNTYRVGADGRTRLVETLQTHTYPPEKVVENYRFHFEALEAENVPDSEFTLTAFGLPEVGTKASTGTQPTAVPRPANYSGRIHLWMIGGAGLLFALAFALRRISLRTA